MTTTNEMQAALEQIVALLGTGNCKINKCESCEYEKKEAIAIAKAALATPSVAPPQHIFDADSPSQDCSCGWKTTPEHRFTAEQAHKAWRRHKDSVEPAAPVGEPGRTPGEELREKLIRTRAIAELKLVTTRFNILLARFRGCDEHCVEHKEAKRHEVSMEEIPAWIQDIEDALQAIAAAPPAQGAPTPVTVEDYKEFCAETALNWEHFGINRDGIEFANWILAKRLAAQGAPGTREALKRLDVLAKGAEALRDNAVGPEWQRQQGRAEGYRRSIHELNLWLAQPGAPTKEVK
jgi:hypothetical protein